MPKHSLWQEKITCCCKRVVCDEPSSPRGSDPLHATTQGRRRMEWGKSTSPVFWEGRLALRRAGGVDGVDPCYGRSLPPAGGGHRRCCLNLCCVLDKKSSFLSKYVVKRDKTYTLSSVFKLGVSLVLVSLVKVLFRLKSTRNFLFQPQIEQEPRNQS